MLKKEYEVFSHSFIALSQSKESKWTPYILSIPESQIYQERCGDHIKITLASWVKIKFCIQNNANSDDSAIIRQLLWEALGGAHGE